MAMKMGNGSQTSMSDINITPLVDVMLVLLVIFMVTAPMLSTKESKVHVPPVDTGETMNFTKEDVIFELKRDKSIHFYGCKECKSLTLNNLTDLKENPKVKNKKVIYLFGDQDLKYRFILKVMAAMHRVGIPHVGLVTNPASLEDGKK